MDNLELFRLIGSISRRATREVNQRVKEYGLDNNLFLYLLRIFENPGLTQYELIQLVEIDKTTMSRALKKLLDMGYIRKEIDLENKNFKKLFPTDRAIGIQKEIAQIESQYVDDRLADLSASEREELAMILLKIQVSSTSK